MLVLSRRPGEKILFPNIGVTVEVVRVNGNAVRIGIHAPPSLKILRQELGEQATDATLANATLTPHELNNRLNRINLAMHLFRRQRDECLFDEAEETLSHLFAGLESLDKDSTTSQAVGQVATKRSRALCRTLVVEDDANERVLLAGLLSMNGCDCATAADGQEALDYLRNHDRPSVVLLDMHMPRCDGPNTLRAIRDEPRLADLRVFSVSGTSPQDMGITIGPGGIDAWFPKPLNPSSLWEAVQKSVSSSASAN